MSPLVKKSSIVPSNEEGWPRISLSTPMKVTVSPLETLLPKFSVECLERLKSPVPLTGPAILSLLVKMSALKLTEPSLVNAPCERKVASDSGVLVSVQVDRAGR